MIEIIYGDLLDSKEKYIAHICNCVTNNAAGIAKNIFDKYPYADSYKNRILPTETNTIEIFGNGIDQRFIINIYSMLYPGAPKYPESKKDGTIVRQNYFYQCLLKISQISNLESIAFPYGIGCNLAGGNWNYYFGVLENFAKFVNKKETKVTLYRKGK